jgi:DNA end-binding protein Ku
MPRSLWSGAISFGLVNIPVQLNSAVRDQRPHFHLLHEADTSPIRYQRVCEREGKAVPWPAIVKGFEYEKGQYAVLTKEDFERAALEKSKTIDILNFVAAEEIDDRYFETPYYVVPARGGERGYALLREAIRRAGKVGVAQIILREKQHLAALSVVGDALVLTTMRLADELQDVGELSFPNAKNVRDKELDMAEMLVQSLAAPWDPSQYHDQYRANLMAIIKSKMKGKEPRLSMPGPGPHGPQVVDLMEKLRASLGQAARPARARTATRTRTRTGGRTRAGGRTTGRTRHKGAA